MKTATWNDSMPASEGVAFFAAEYLAGPDATKLARLLHALDAADMADGNGGFDLAGSGVSGCRAILASELGDAAELVGDAEIHVALAVLESGDF